MKRLIPLIFIVLLSWTAHSQNCTASFTAVTDSGLIVDFFDNSTSVGTIISWTWDFGNGTYGTGPQTSTIFNSPGWYHICLTIATDDSCYHTTCDSVHITGIDPCAGFSVSLAVTDAGGPVMADGSIQATVSGGTPPCTFIWNTGANTNYLDSLNPGTYCLTVTDANGCTTDACTTVSTDTSGGTFCHASFIASPDSAGLISFTDQSWAQANITSWFWEFDALGSSSLQNPHFVFPSNGLYTVCLVISTTDGCTSTYCDSVYVLNLPADSCTASFSWMQAWCGDNCFVFTDGSVTNSGIINSWLWDFGNGNMSTQQNPEFIFGIDPGPYQVCLTITTSQGCTNSSCETITGDTVNNNVCEAAFVIDSTIINCPNCYLFTDASTTNDIISWFWDLGDGTTHYGQSVIYTYPGPGTYTVCLTIITIDSCTNTSCQTFSIGGSIPSCHAAFGITPAYCPNCYLFSDSSQGQVITWHWNFGDGTSGTGQIADHTFPGPGTWNVCLTIATADSCTDTHCEVLIIPDDSCSVSFGIIPANCPGCYGFVDNTAANVVSWSWDFGDGDSSSLQFPVHSYADTGQYNVCLTAGLISFLGDTLLCFQCQTLQVTEPASGGFSVSGLVHTTSGLLQDGVVIIFLEAGSYFAPVQYQTVTNGAFFFDNLTAGAYIIYAIPNPDAVPGYFPTFYVNKLLWDEATPIQVNGDVYDLDIGLQEATAPITGNGSLGGMVVVDDPSVYESYIFGNDWFIGNKEMNSVTARNIPVFLFDQTGAEALMWTLSDEYGNFEFSDLAYGSYTLVVQKPGLLCYNPPVITIDAANPYQNDIQVTLRTSDIIFGIPGVNESILNGIPAVFPNPVIDILFIELEMKEDAEVGVSITNALGKILYNYTKHGNVGKQRILTDMKAFAPGIYFLSVRCGNSILNYKIAR